MSFIVSLFLISFNFVVLYFIMPVLRHTDPTYNSPRRTIGRRGTPYPDWRSVLRRTEASEPGSFDDLWIR